jgi:hypothetical protein
VYKIFTGFFLSFRQKSAKAFSYTIKLPLFSQFEGQKDKKQTRRLAGL